MIHDLALARAIHVLGLIHWIGGMAVVTTIVLPRARALPDAGQAIEVFEAFERRFSSQVRISILLVGLSGGYMVTKLDAWDLFQRVSFWWLHLMVAVWLLFALVVFVLEPTFLHRSFHASVVREKDRFCHGDKIPRRGPHHSCCRNCFRDIGCRRSAAMTTSDQSRSRSRCLGAVRFGYGRSIH